MADMIAALVRCGWGVEHISDVLDIPVRRVQALIKEYGIECGMRGRIHRPPEQPRRRKETSHDWHPDMGRYRIGGY